MPVAMQARTLRLRSSLACGAGRKMFIVFRFSEAPQTKTRLNVVSMFWNPLAPTELGPPGA